ncbi:MAG: hypothetical protein H6581_00595 [Bacteroidia bacterium]|nr:hypothetical protein [Bacteroidia bacterium]
MKIDNLFIPGHLSPLFSQLYEFKKEANEENGEISFFIPESWLVSVFQKMGAFSGEELSDSGLKNETHPEKCKTPPINTDNQSINTPIPEEILEIMRTQRVNVVRAIMILKNLSLKEVATAYGGSSGQANVSNFLARSDEELGAMRSSTVARLAKAMDFPPADLLRYLGKDQD